jgi:hypothetical protein
MVSLQEVHLETFGIPYREGRGALDLNYHGRGALLINSNCPNMKRITVSRLCLSLEEISQLPEFILHHLDFAKKLRFDPLLLSLLHRS